VRELLSALEKERDALSGHVGKLRDFESTYRDSLVTHLSGLVDDLKNRKFEPADAPRSARHRPSSRTAARRRHVLTLC